MPGVEVCATSLAGCSICGRDVSFSQGGVENDRFGLDP
jgi:hypothetical protein